MHNKQGTMFINLCGKYPALVFQLDACNLRLFIYNFSFSNSSNHIAALFGRRTLVGFHDEVSLQLTTVV